MADFRTIVVPGAAALAELDRLRAEAAATGLRPVLLGGPDQIDRIFPVIHGRSRFLRRPTVARKRYDPALVAPTLAAAAAIDPARWFEDRAREEEEYAEDDEEDVPEAVAWPIGPPEGMGIITHLNLGGRKPLPEVVIGLFPMAAPWMVFAHLDYGGWNACPEAAEHCAIQRSWAERFGAEVVAVTGDAVECTVARPPADRDASRALAREQYLYCNDIVDQGCGSVEALAASLWQAPTWFFWWD